MYTNQKLRELHRKRYRLPFGVSYGVFWAHLWLAPSLPSPTFDRAIEVKKLRENKILILNRPNDKTNRRKEKKSGLNPGTAITPGQHGLLLSRPKGSLVPCADTFRDKLLLDGSQSRGHKGPPPSFNTTAESMHSAHISLLNIP